MSAPPPLPPGPGRRLRRRLVRARRRLLAWRRPLAALSAALAAGLALHANAAPPPPTTAVLVAARDLPPGAALRPGDVRTAPFPPDRVPAGALVDAAQARGRTTVGAVRAGEPLTDVRLLDDGLLSRYPGRVVVPVRIGDAATVRLLRPGDRVTILAADPQAPGPATEVARAVPVLAVPPPGPVSDPALAGGALVVLAVPELTARTLAGAAAGSFLSVALVG